MIHKGSSKILSTGRNNTLDPYPDMESKFSDLEKFENKIKRSISYISTSKEEKHRKAVEIYNTFYKRLNQAREQSSPKRKYGKIRILQKIRKELEEILDVDETVIQEKIEEKRNIITEIEEKTRLYCEKHDLILPDSYAGIISACRSYIRSVHKEDLQKIASGNVHIEDFVDIVSSIFERRIELGKNELSKEKLELSEYDLQKLETAYPDLGSKKYRIQSKNFKQRVKNAFMDDYIQTHIALIFGHHFHKKENKFFFEEGSIGGYFAFSILNIDRFTQLPYFLSKLHERYHISCVEHYTSLAKKKKNMEIERNAVIDTTSRKIEEQIAKEKAYNVDKNKKKLPKEIEGFIDGSASLIYLSKKKRKQFYNKIKKIYYTSTPLDISKILGELEVPYSEHTIDEITILAEASTLGNVIIPRKIHTFILESVSELQITAQWKKKKFIDYMTSAYTKFGYFDSVALNKAITVHLSPAQIDFLSKKGKKNGFPNKQHATEAHSTSTSIREEVNETVMTPEHEIMKEKNTPLLTPYLKKHDEGTLTQEDFVQAFVDVGYTIANKKLLMKQYNKRIGKGTEYYADTKRILRMLLTGDLHRNQFNEHFSLKMKHSGIRLVRRGNMIENLLDHANYELTYREYWIK